MKLFKLALFTLSLGIYTTTPTWAADITQENNTYQSSFDGYKPLSEDNLSDWKSINVPSNGAGHTEQSMAGMQHKMTPEQMANMASVSNEMPAMEGMDHSKMPGMEMDHGSMKSMSGNKPQVPSMKKEDMPEMNRDEMAGNNHGGSDIKAMDHSKMSESKPNVMQPNHDSTAQDESLPHEHATGQRVEHAEMSMPSMAPLTQVKPWQVIPNFHPIVVHFPIALTVIAFIFSFAAYVRRNHPVSLQLATAGHFTLWLAAIGAAVAVLFGWLAYNSVNHDDAGHAAMLLHRSWAIPTAVGLILLASWDAWKYHVNELISVPMLFVLFLLSQSIAMTGWLGGEVVYRYGVGVLSLPTSEGAGHSHHQHGEAASAGHSHEENITQPESASGHHQDAEYGEHHEH